MVKNWVKRTPDNFRFTAKFPKVITHDKLLVDVELSRAEDTISLVGSSTFACY